MIALGLFGILCFLEKRYIKSLLGLVLSILVKYATALLIPGIMAKGLLKVKDETFFYILTVSMVVATLFATYRTNFQPWYFYYFCPTRRLFKKNTCNP